LHYQILKITAMSNPVIQLQQAIVDNFKSEKGNEESKNKPFKFEIIQPNKVTNARYSYNEVQENILTCIMMGLQDQIFNKTDIQRDLFGNPMVVIDCANMPTGANNKSHVWNSCKDLRKKDIEFEWTAPTGETREVTTGLINTASWIKGTSKIEIEISKWAIPFLLYWGKGVGGTQFDCSIALVLKGEHTKRLYKLCSRWKDKGGFTMPLPEFRDMMMLENKYPDNKDLKKRVLEPSKTRINEMSDLEVQYDLVKRGGSKEANFINFKILSNASRKINDKPNTWYSFIWGCLNRIYPNFKSDKATTICDELANTQQLRHAFDRFARLDDDLTNGKIKLDDFIKIGKTILRDDYFIKI